MSQLDTENKAGFFRKYLIILKVLRAIINASIASLWYTYFVKEKRKRADQKLDWMSKKLLQAVDLKFEVFNESGFTFKDDVPYVLMSNHLSHYDIPLLMQAFTHQSVRMLTKKELFKVPLWGKGMKNAEFISIDRKNQKQALRDIETAKKAMQSGIRLWVAPEGTRSREGHLLPFKRGGFKIAIDLNATILPIGIIGSNKALPPDKFNFYLHQNAEVHIGKPVDCSSYDMKNVKELMAEVETQIRELGKYGPS